MKYYSARDYLIFFGLLGTGGLLGLFFGSLAWGLVLSLSAWVLYQNMEYLNFRRWARTPLKRPVASSDAWQNGMDDLYRTLQRSRENTHLALHRIREMRAVTTALPDAAVLVGIDGRILGFNSTARDMLNLQQNDIGNSLGNLVRHPAFIALLRDVVEGDVIELTSPFNDQMRLEVRVIPVGDEQSLILVRDITQLNRLLTMRQDFVANVSHELRTPLTIVIGYLETMLEDDMDLATTRELLEKLRSPTQRMQVLVHDLLLLTRLESSPPITPGEMDSIDMNHLLGTVVQETEGLSDGRHKLKLEVTLNRCLKGNEQEIHSAVTNLVSNAIRYSPDGGDVIVRWKQAEDGAVLEVQDQGMGIPTEHLSRLTERFYRVDLARARVQGGTGLGLAIVKHILKRHNTTLHVSSTLGTGSLFYCKFPTHQLDEIA